MPINEGYEMALYCDNAENPYDEYNGHGRGFFSGPSRRWAVKDAKQAGWKFLRGENEGKVTCPICNQRKKKDAR